MPVSAVDCFQPAIQHTREQLFRPFRFGQWSRLALVGILAAQMRTASCNFSTNFNWPHPRRAQEFAATPFPGLEKFDPSRIAEFAGLIIAVVVLAIVLGLIFLYINSVFRFILFDSVLSKRCAIREGWHRWHRAGRRYFLWQIVLLIAQGLFLGVLVAVPLAIAAALGWFNNVEQHMARTVLGVALLIFIFLFWLLATLTVQQIASDFLVPIMALDDVDFADGWSRLIALIRPEPGKFAVYLLLKIVLAIAAAILFGILAFIPALIIVLPAVLVAIAAHSAGVTWTVATVSLAVICGAFLIVLLIYVIALVSVPATVFFPAFAIYFFASRYPKLDAILHPAPPASPAPATEAPLPEPTTPTESEATEPASSPGPNPSSAGASSSETPPLLPGPESIG
ncbi:MAG: hypothetical protein WAK13_09610 [Terriglobales bacterium]